MLHRALTKFLDKEFKRKGLSTILEKAERGELNVRTCHGEFLAAPIYIREDVFQKIVSLPKGRDDFLGRSIEARIAERIAFRFEFKEKNDSFFAKVSTKGLSKKKKDKLYDEWGDLKDRQDRIESETKYLGSDLLRVTDLANPKECEEISAIMIEFELFLTGLNMLNITMTPKRSRGEDNFEILTAWYKEIAEIAETEDQRLRKMWGWEEEG